MHARFGEDDSNLGRTVHVRPRIIHPVIRLPAQVRQLLTIGLILLLASGMIRATAGGNVGGQNKQHTIAVVIVPVANMYSSASEDVDVVSQAIVGSNVEALEESSGWEKVRTNDHYSDGCH